MNDKTSKSQSFYYTNHLPPSITSTTSTCFYHSTVVMEGYNLSIDKVKDIVKFGTEIATVTYATNDSLTVTTPDLGMATSADITVVRDRLVSNTTSIHVDFDQNKVATYDWTADTIRIGLIYKTGEVTLFGHTLRRIYVLDVTLNSTNTLGIAF